MVMDQLGVQKATHQAVVAAAITRIDEHLEQLRAEGTAVVCVSLAHLFAAGGVGSDSERELSTGNLDVVQVELFEHFDYSALGHLHGRQQVREILGTPLVTSLFHADRWEYVFTLKRPGVEVQSRRLTVFFKDNVLDHTEGDEMPSEAEFVASLASKVSQPKVPQLEATDDQLARFPARPDTAPPLDAQPPATPPATHYPPLESPRR